MHRAVYIVLIHNRLESRLSENIANETRVICFVSEVHFKPEKASISAISCLVDGFIEIWLQFLSI